MNKVFFIADTHFGEDAIRPSNLKKIKYNYNKEAIFILSGSSLSSKEFIKYVPKTKRYGGYPAGRDRHLAQNGRDHP